MLLLHYVRLGRITAHPRGGHYKKLFFVDVDEAREVLNKPFLHHLIKDLPENMVTCKEAAKRLKLSESTIKNYLKKGYIKKHYIEGSDKYFVVDMNELTSNSARVDNRRLDRDKDLARLSKLRSHVSQLERDDKGRFIKKTSPET